MRLVFRLDYSNRIDRVLQHGRLNVAQRCYLSRGFVGGFLDHVPHVALGPAPLDLMPAAGFVQTFPPLVIRLAAKAPAHRFHYVAGIGVQTHPARLFQGFQPERRRNDFRLLICSLSEISAERAPQSLISEQRDRSRAGLFSSIAQTRAVTENCD